MLKNIIAIGPVRMEEQKLVNFFSCRPWLLIICFAYSACKRVFKVGVHCAILQEVQFANQDFPLAV